MADFENFARHDVIIQQLIQSIGSSGALITPQEAASIYQREHQELSSQIVFFSARSYLASVHVTPEARRRNFTRITWPNTACRTVCRSIMSLFNITNFLAQSKAEWAKTNLDEQVDAIYFQYGAQAFPDAKTPEDAKEKIRDTLIRSRALAAARVQANDFASTVFALPSARAENLATVARQKGLTVQTTAPFTAETGPQEFAAPEGFAKIAFGLTADEPFANPIVGAGRRLCHRASPAAAQRNPAVRRHPRPCDAGLSNAAGHRARPGGRNELLKSSSRSAWPPEKILPPPASPPACNRRFCRRFP